MFKLRVCLVFLAFFVGVHLVIADFALAAVVSDDFEDGVLAPLWSDGGLGNYSVVENDGRLNIHLPSGSNQLGYALSSFALMGDFDISIEFEEFGPGAAQWNRQAALVIRDITDPSTVFGNIKILDPWVHGRRIYQMYFPLYYIDQRVSAGGQQISGAFRFVRTGSSSVGQAVPDTKRARCQAQPDLRAGLTT